MKPTFGIVVTAVAIAVTILANAGVLILPAFLPVLTHNHGLTEAQGGLFVTAEYGGVGIGAMVCAMLPSVVERLNWRRTAALGLLAVIVANLAMAAPTGFLSLLVLGLFAGTGTGLVNAVLYAILAEGDGARLMGAFTTAQLGLATVGVGVVSAIVNRHGDAGAFIALAAVGVVALPLCALLPLRGLTLSHDNGSALPEADRISALGWASALSLLIFSIAWGAVYAFLGYMGLAWGGKPAAVDAAISGIMFVGMIGALIVTVVGSRFGTLWPLALSTVGTVLGLALFIVFKPTGMFLPIGGLLYFSVNVATAYLFGAVTDIDRSSGAAMLMAASQVGGYAIGPAIAGYLVTPDYAQLNELMLALFIMSSLIVFGVAWMRRRQEDQIYTNTSARMEG